MKRLLLCLFLVGCGGGTYDASLNLDETQTNALKCGVGAYWVPPTTGFPNGKCYLYQVDPAASAPTS